MVDHAALVQRSLPQQKQHAFIKIIEKHTQLNGEYSDGNVGAVLLGCTHRRRTSCMAHVAYEK